jgi:nucleotide-binding universal stress UspA family protein
MEISAITVPLAVDVSTEDKLSIPSRTALAAGRALAHSAGLDLRLVTAVHLEMAERATGILQRVANGAGGPDAHTRTIVLQPHQPTEQVLLDALTSQPDELWCIGSHGRTAVGEMVFGSVSADLVRDAGSPIVVAGPYAKVAPDAEVLAVALDGGPLDHEILPAAVSVANALGLRIRLLQVGQPHPEKGNDAFDTNYLAAVAHHLPDPDHADYDTLYGDPHHALPAYVNDEPDIALLAMATRGVPAGARVSYPSTALRVLRHAAVPLLMLHPLDLTELILSGES